MPTVTFLPAIEAWRVREATNMISIQAEDIDEADWLNEDHNLCTPRLENLEDFPMNMVEVNKIVEFADSIVGQDVVVHCQYGQSRSAAVAKWFQDYRGYEVNLKARGCYGKLTAYSRPYYEALALAHLRSGQQSQPSKLLNPEGL